jgi:Putative beta-barrel porin-2, OmpL-like. bbp2
MKFNKWTVGLAAVGAVSLASVVQADNSALANVSSTILSGYVDTSMQWNLGTGDSHAPDYKYGGSSKADGFNLDVIKVTLEKPLDRTDWAAGYKVDLLMGPDADVFGSQSTLSTGKSDFAIKQAYVALAAPIGNGIDFKVGVFDSIIGYESTESINNPNFTRSWGHTFEPSTFTGVLATYHANNVFAFSVGIADTMSPAINSRAGSGLVGSANESDKTFMAALALTAPEDWGFAAGSSFYAGMVQGFNFLPGGADTGANQMNYYLGATLQTPVTGFRVGASFDYAKTDNTLTPIGGVPAGFPAYASFGAHSFAGYLSFQATEKLSVHGRIEYADVSPLAADAAQASNLGIPSADLAVTGTLQYDLWKNVLSRVEFRWDHALDGTDAFGGTGPTQIQGGHLVTGTLKNSYILAANVVYKF